ncbi:hypothetical protein RE0356_26620 [Prescottella equi]|nr:hypothetical protein RE0356_26620 [Prescottella equi]
MADAGALVIVAPDQRERGIGKPVHGYEGDVGPLTVCGRRRTQKETAAVGCNLRKPLLNRARPPSCESALRPVSIAGSARVANSPARDR